MSQFNDQHHYTFGAQSLRDSHGADHTRFRLWAPSAQVAHVVINDVAYAMQAQSAGWYQADVACGAGTHYKFETVDQDGNALRFADPASRAQAGDIHDQSIVVDPLAYHWQFPLWRGRPWHETVVYELHAGVLGGFEAVQHKLAGLAELGITAIELMPVADFPGTRNWGYDGVLMYAPDASYGTPEQLKALIDTAHGLGLMVFLDVVYNHFGPDGNYLGAYAKPFFRDDVHTPWGQAIDFSKRQVRDFFTENALYWLSEYRFDGLRFDAVHMISEQDWLVEMGQRIRREIRGDRHVHLVLEHDGNAAHFLGNTYDAPFNAQWNDDGHHVLHTLLTGEQDHYYLDYSDRPAEKLARCLGEGFVYQGELTLTRAEPRGVPSAHLSPSSFVLFVQNHDQIGNRAFGERLSTLVRPSALRAATALVMLSPQIPLMFMGDEIGATEPFLFFTSHTEELAQAVRDGRRQEFVAFAAFADAQQREKIPDPNAIETFIQSKPVAGEHAEESRAWIASLLHVRRTQLFHHLQGCRPLGACVLGDAAVAARWQLSNGAVLAIAINLAPTEVSVKLDDIAKTAGADLLFETSGVLSSLERDCLPPDSFIALLEHAA